MNLGLSVGRKSEAGKTEPFKNSTDEFRMDRAGEAPKCERG